MSDDSKMDTAVNNRLRKYKYDWNSVNKNYVFNKNIDNVVKIRLYNALILSILLYEIQILPLNGKLLKKLQTSHSECIRYITDDTYDMKTRQESY